MARFRPTHEVAPRPQKPPYHEGHSHRKACPMAAQLGDQAGPDPSGVTCWEYVDALDTIDRAIG